MSVESDRRDADAELAGEARSRRAMARTFAWGIVTLVLLWWFARSYSF